MTIGKFLFEFIQGHKPNFLRDGSQPLCHSVIRRHLVIQQHCHSVIQRHLVIQQHSVILRPLVIQQHCHFVIQRHFVITSNCILTLCHFSTIRHSTKLSFCHSTTFCHFPLQYASFIRFLSVGVFCSDISYTFFFKGPEKSHRVG